jgi:hypothetical protein
MQSVCDLDLWGLFADSCWQEFLLLDLRACIELVAFLRVCGGGIENSGTGSLIFHGVSISRKLFVRWETQSCVFVDMLRSSHTGA